MQLSKYSFLSYELSVTVTMSQFCVLFKSSNTNECRTTGWAKKN